MAVSNACCVCGNQINSRACAHPWRDAFQTWPPVLLLELKRTLRAGVHPRS